MRKLILLFLIPLLFAPQIGRGQGLTSTDIYNSFKYRMKSDNLTFPDTEIYQLVNFGTEISCVLGFAYPKVDTLVLSTGTEEYGLTKLAVWVYRVGKIGESERSWSNIKLSDFGDYTIKDAIVPAYYDFVTVIENLTSEFDAGNDTSYLYVFPKPTAGDNNDSILVHYFAWVDTIDANLQYVYHDVVLELALMGGYIRKGRSDMAVMAWNKAGMLLSKLRNDWLARIYDIEVVPKSIGGQ